MINEELLLKYGATLKKLQKEQVLFQEGSSSTFYYQVRSGEMIMFNLSDGGKEFIQGIFTAGQSFGEPALFGGFPYPASARALQPTVLLRISYERLLVLLKDHFEIQVSILSNLSKRLAYKSMIMKEISSYNPEHRILTLLDFLKKEHGEKGTPYEVKLSRQKIADLTGLRVETVIRAIQSLKQKKELFAKGRRVFR